jgi:uncharacterized protein (TIGR04540 family)
LLHFQNLFQFTALNQLVDVYWQEKIKETEVISGIKRMFENNQDKLLKDNQFTTIVQQQCGKRRLVVVGKVLEKENITS